MVNSRISELSTALKDIQEAANNDTKSSAGDKYETGREMAQLEANKISTQLAEANKQKKVLNKIDLSKNKTIGLGSLVVTTNGTFYLAVGLGKIEIEGQTIFVVSSLSPIGQLLLNKKEKESFFFNNINYEILKVF